jgi:hypothetical protein
MPYLTTEGAMATLPAPCTTPQTRKPRKPRNAPDQVSDLRARIDNRVVNWREVRAALMRPRRRPIPGYDPYWPRCGIIAEDDLPVDAYPGERSAVYRSPGGRKRPPRRAAKVL